jgi:DNA invertase Pin-like site-specific DNA recombinase
MARIVQPDASRRVYGYCRVSTAGQADSGISLDEQEHRIRARCHEHSWSIEAGVSDSTPLNKRPQGSRLLAALRPGDTMIAAPRSLLSIGGRRAERHRGLQAAPDYPRALGLGDCTGNGVSELILTVLAACAQFEHQLISERIAATKADLRRANKHQGGLRRFGWVLGEATGSGKARTLVPDLAEQQAILDIVAMRNTGMTLMAIRDAIRAQGFAISHQSVANIVERH